MLVEAMWEKGMYLFTQLMVLGGLAIFHALLFKAIRLQRQQKEWRITTTLALILVGIELILGAIVLSSILFKVMGNSG